MNPQKPQSIVNYFLHWENILLVLLGLVILVNSQLSPYFLDIFNLFDSTFNFSEKAIIALPMALVIISRDIDLSVASTIALSSLFMGMAGQAGAGVWTLVSIGLVTGLMAGMFNGFIITHFSIPAIVVTIGTMSLFRGISFVVLGDQAYTTFPQGFGFFGQDALFDLIPYEFIFFLILAAVFAFVLHFTTVGRKIFALGTNPEAAFYSGVPVNKYRFVILSLTGLLSGFSAILLTSRVGSTRPDIALGWELEIITMVILGGVNIMGGKGTIYGVIISIFVLGMAKLGMGLINVPGIVMNIFLGGLLIGTLLLSNFVTKYLSNQSG
ncbi:MAG: ABC transporter permease [Proteobacteria bacterium]|nr:ABC transporter permease [Pseudomonadota bacterium]